MRTFTLSVTAALLASSAAAGPALDRAKLADDIRATLGAEYDLSDFNEIAVRIRRTSIEIDAEGESVELTRTYAVTESGLGALLEGEDTVETDRVVLSRVFEDGVWDDFEEDDDDEEDDEEDDDDDRGDDDDDDDDDDEDDGDDDDDDDDEDDDDDDEEDDDDDDDADGDDDGDDD
ncbi:MAG: hypothetical protein AAF871_12635 [Pseudomonadota bacterium]